MKTNIRSPDKCEIPLEFLFRIKHIIFIDVVAANLKVFVFRKNRIWKKKEYYWFAFRVIGNATVKLFFKPDDYNSKEEMLAGWLTVEVSFPKILCTNNIGGFPVSDIETVCFLVDNLLLECKVETGGIGFECFSLKKIEFSMSSCFNSAKELNEADRLFRMHHFSRHRVGECCRLKNHKAEFHDGDYETSFYFGSASSNILMYNKPSEIKDKEPQADDEDEKDDENQLIYPYILRFEIKQVKSSESKKLSYKDFKVFDLVEAGNILVANHFNHYNLSCDFVPKEEFFEIIESFLNDLRKSRVNRKKHPFLDYSNTKLIDFFERINDIGAEAAYKENKPIYRACEKLASKLNMSVLFTKLKRRFNLFENVIALFDDNIYFCLKRNSKGGYVFIEFVYRHGRLYNKPFTFNHGFYSVYTSVKSNTSKVKTKPCFHQLE